MPGFGGNVVRAFNPASSAGASWTQTGVARDWANVQGYLGSWRQATDVFVYDAGQWKKVWIRLTAPTTVTATLSSSTSLTGTLTWSGASGAAGYKIYRNGALITTITDGAITSTSISIPEYYVNYTYSVAAYFGGLDTTATSASAISAVLPAPTLSATIPSSYTYTATDDWTGVYPVIRLTWTAVSGVSTYQVLRNGVLLASVSGTSYDYTTTTSATFTVRAIAAIGTAGPTSNARTMNVGQPRLRTTTSNVYTGDAQSSHPGTTNGQFNVRFRGDLFNTWVYQVKWTLTVTSFSTFEITNYPNRKIRLTYPGGPFEVPDGRPLGWDRTISVSGQDVTVGVDPYGSAWTSSGSGTIGTFHVDVTIRIYYTYVTQSQVDPSIS